MLRGIANLFRKKKPDHQAGASGSDPEGAASASGSNAAGKGQKAVTSGPVPKRIISRFKKSRNLFWSISYADVYHEMKYRMDYVKEKIPGESGGVAKALLIYFEWNVNAVLVVLNDPGMRTQAYEQADIPVFENPEVDPRKNPEKFCVFCPKCSGSISNLVHLLCGHELCCICDHAYLKTKVDDVVLTCPNRRCDRLLEDEVVMRALGSTPTRWTGDFFDYIQPDIMNFTMCNSNYAYCYKCDCFLLKKDPNAELKLVTCLCGHKFCWICGQFNHEPIPCSLVTQWTRFLQEPTETKKTCPECNRIVGTGGKIFACSQCAMMFCWVCKKRHPESNHFCYNVQYSLITTFKADVYRCLFFDCFRRFNWACFMHRSWQDFVEAKTNNEKLQETLTEFFVSNRSMLFTALIFCNSDSPKLQDDDDFKSRFYDCLQNFFFLLETLAEKYRTQMDLVELTNQMEACKNYNQELLALITDAASTTELNIKLL